MEGLLAQSHAVRMHLRRRAQVGLL
jgi:hypothetical protein